MDGVINLFLGFMYDLQTRSCFQWNSSDCNDGVINQLYLLKKLSCQGFKNKEETENPAKKSSATLQNWPTSTCTDASNVKRGGNK